MYANFQVYFGRLARLPIEVPCATHDIAGGAVALSAEAAASGRAFGTSLESIASINGLVGIGLGDGGSHGDGGEEDGDDADELHVG